MSRFIATALLCTVGAFAGCAGPSQTVVSSPTGNNTVAEVGYPAPAITLQTVLQAPPGTKATLAELKGKVLVLEFWATWCGPCVMAIPHLNELAEQFEGQPVRFISVTSQKEDVVQEFLKKRPIRGWVGLDADRSTSRAYGVRGIPHTVLIDKNGKIAGFPSAEAVTKEVLNDMLAGKKPNLPEWALKRREEQRREAKEATNDPIYEVSIRPSNNIAGGGPGTIGRGYRKLEGWTLLAIIANCFDVSRRLVIAETELPAETYDVVVVAPHKRRDSVQGLLQTAIEMTFGLSCAREKREMDAYHLNIALGGLKEGFKPADYKGGAGGGGGPKNLQAVNMGLGMLARMLEERLETPVTDRTDLEGRYDFELTVQSWEEADVNAALREQFGLELVPVREPVEVVVVRQADPADK